jgi:tetraacyldisaccharide 4'-kinase
VAKDLSLVVVDSEYGFGNGRVIPAGPLRSRLRQGSPAPTRSWLFGNGPAPQGWARYPVDIAGCPGASE